MGRQECSFLVDKIDVNNVFLFKFGERMHLTPQRNSL